MKYLLWQVSLIDIAKCVGCGTGLVDGPTNTAKFCNPGGLCIDTNGVIIIADTENHTLRYLANQQVLTIAGIIKFCWTSIY